MLSTSGNGQYIGGITKVYITKNKKSEHLDQIRRFSVHCRDTLIGLGDIMTSLGMFRLLEAPWGTNVRLGKLTDKSYLILYMANGDVFSTPQ